MIPLASIGQSVMIAVAHRHRIAEGRSDAFLERFETDYGVTEQPGFLGFKVLAPVKADTHVALSFWESRDHLRQYMGSEAFKRANMGSADEDIWAEEPSDEPPKFGDIEIHEVVIDREPADSSD